MKSDGSDQMNTVAKTAEYPFERLALRREAASLCNGDTFISNVVCHAQRTQRAPAWAYRIRGAPKLRPGLLHKFSRLSLVNRAKSRRRKTYVEQATNQWRHRIDSLCCRSSGRRSQAGKGRRWKSYATWHRACPAKTIRRGC